MTISHETDFYGWVFEQTTNLKAKNFARLDIENIVEELESMGRSERGKFESHLKILIAHLLKWKYAPEKKTNSWKLSINTHRDEAKSVLDENPSLKHKLNERFHKCYKHAVALASIETNKNEEEFPKQCPWTFEQIMEDNFLP